MGFNILNTGASALRTAQRAVETAAHNAANSTTEGYTRQRVTTAATVPVQGADGVVGSGHRGTGVQVVSVDRMRDALADLAVRSESANAGFQGARAQTLDRAQGILGVYGAGVPDALTDMFAAFDQLALTPNEPAARQIVVDRAGSFAAGLNNAAGQLEEIRGEVRARALSEVKEVNAIAKEIASLNKHIVSALNGGQSPNDLLDRRDLLVDKLSSLTGATVRQSENGSVSVRIGGMPLVQGPDAFELEVSLEKAHLTLSLHDKAVTLSGTLGGRVSVMAGELQQFEEKINDLADSVSRAVNFVHERGEYGDGSTGGAFFTSRQGAGAAAGLQVAVTTDTLAAARVLPGGTFSPLNGDNALLLANLRNVSPDVMQEALEAPENALLTTDQLLAEIQSTLPEPEHQGSLTEQVSVVAQTLGQAAASSAAASETAEIALTSLTAQREAANGVSIDEEMIELVKFQHSYDAAARVISIADEMLDVLINRMGAR
jgi:flagellar hook-associated protein 1 FlgK